MADGDGLRQVRLVEIVGDRLRRAADDIDIHPVRARAQNAAQAGRAAAKYVQGGSKETAEPLSGGIKLEAKGGVRYTVPSIIHPENMPDTLTVRFRVGGIYKNSFISVYFGDQRVQHRKKTVMAPGEMEQVLLKKADLQNIDFDTVTVTVEAE